MPHTVAESLLACLQYNIEPQEKAKRWCAAAACHRSRAAPHGLRRALASLAVFDALHEAVETTGVHVRRVHYLYREAAAAPTQVRAAVPYRTRLY